MTQNIWELMSGWNEKNIPIPKINLGKQNKQVDS